MKLYNFFRSGTSHRLRIALNLKGIATDYVAVDLRVEEHLKDAFKAVNPQQLVPALDTGEQVLIQSPAIIEWLEEKHPTPALLPTITPYLLFGFHAYNNLLMNVICIDYQFLIQRFLNNIIFQNF